MSPFNGSQKKTTSSEMVFLIICLSVRLKDDFEALLHKRTEFARKPRAEKHL